jgi:hypothetical protein
MKLDTTLLTYIKNVVDTANILKIENIVIEPTKVRAMSDDQTTVIFQTTNVPDLAFGSICLNRLPEFVSRFAIIRSTVGFEITATTTGDDNTIPCDPKISTPRSAMWVKSLHMEGLNTSIDYRCTNPALVRAPRSMNHTPQHEIQMTENTITLMQKGKLAMKAEHVKFIGNKQGTFMVLLDINGDQLKHKLSSTISDFTHTYPIDKLITIFKLQPNATFFITNLGFFKCSINELDVYIAAKL